MAIRSKKRKQKKAAEQAALAIDSTQEAAPPQKKVRRRHPVIVFAVFLFSVVLTLYCVGCTVAFGVSGGNESYYDTSSFASGVNTLLNICSSSLATGSEIADEEDDYIRDPEKVVREQVQDNYDGVLVFTYNSTTGKSYTNSSYADIDEFLRVYRKQQSAAESQGDRVVPQFVLELKNGTTTVSSADPYWDDAGVAQYSFDGYYGRGSTYYYYDESESDIHTAIVIPRVAEFRSDYSDLSYYTWADLYSQAEVVPGLVFLALLGFGICFLRRKTLRMFGVRVAARIRRVPYELKYGVSIVGIIGFFISAMEGLTSMYASGYVWGSVLSLTVVYLLILLLYYDLKHNGTATFRNSIPAWFMRIIKGGNMSYQFQRKIRRQFTNFALSILGLCILSLVILLLSVAASSTVLFILFLAVITVAFVLTCRVVKDYFKIIGQLGQVIDQVATISQGNLDEHIPLDPQDDLYPLFYAVQNMQTSIKASIENEVNSEKMKVDLITNVSHDLKTPLTSIISYTQLLKAEELQPPEANDYVSIIDRKSQRLKTLVQDIFDLSKATSGNMDLVLEPLDIAQLLEQAVGELEQPIQNSQLTVTLSGTGEKVYVLADGVKLYRVLENLIINITKYSLTGSRVYIDLVSGGGQVSLIFKNISSYPMNFTGDQIKERFVRGDLSRTTEGSGLGLAIADSFVALMGGQLDLLVDGDLFKAILTFATIRAPGRGADTDGLSAGTEETGEPTETPADTQLPSEDAAALQQDIAGIQAPVHSVAGPVAPTKPIPRFDPYTGQPLPGFESAIRGQLDGDKKQ